MKHYRLSIIINAPYKIKKERQSMTAAPQFTIPVEIVYNYGN